MADAPKCKQSPLANMEDSKLHDESTSFSFLNYAVGDTYTKLKKSLLPQGRGRPMQLPELPLTNYLLAQLIALQIEGNKTKADVGVWFDRLFPTASYPSSRLPSVLNRFETKMKKLHASGADLDLFLQQEIDFDFVSMSLSQLGLNREELLHEKPWSPPASEHALCVTHEVIMDLENFRSKEKKPPNFTVDWIRKLLNTDESDDVIKLCLKKMKKCYESVRMSKHNKPDEFSLFLCTIFKLYTPDQLKESPTAESTVIEKKLFHENKILSKMEKNVTKKNSELLEKVEQLKNQDSVLNDTIQDLQQEKRQFQLQAERTKKTNDQLQKKVAEQNEQIKQLQPRNLRHLRRKVLQLRAKAHGCLRLQNRLTICELNLNEQKRRTKLEKSAKWKCKAQIVKLKHEVARLQAQVEYLMEELNVKNADGAARPEAQPFREKEKNRFSDNMRQTLMELQGSGNVAASKCGDVIRAVAKHLFNTDLDKKNIPCSSTAVNVANEGHVLAKYEATEKILQTENVTVHLDGTSRHGKKFIGTQVTLDTGEVLSLGFTSLANENSATLLDVTIHLLEEMTNIYAPTDAEKEDISQSLLSKLTSTMTDRAATMKSFDKKLEEFIKSKLGQQASVHFVYCNAHFLLGLSRACDMRLRHLAEDLHRNERKLGRDKIAKFQRFKSTETAASRLIRTASDICGPRGDDKNGCRAEWLGYCDQVGRKSLMTSYRSNRFNAYFEGAAAVLHHLEDLRAFIGNGFLSHSNLKIESVAADCADNTLIALVCAVALIYLRITRPYWELLQSSVTHGEFHYYAKRLETCFEKWSRDSSDLLDKKSEGIFQGEFESVCPAEAAVYDFSAQHQADVEAFLRGMMPGMLETTRNQLKEYLTGKYSHPLSREDQTQLQHCPLTNLVGENVFGELDFDMTKRRNSTLHHRSSVQMLRYNHTSEWLAGKSEEEAAHLLAIARKQSKQLRKQHQRQEEIVKLRVKEQILENERKQRLKEAKLARQRASLIRKVLAHGGPCEKKSDVACLARQLKDSRGNILKEALKDQIRYQKSVLNRKGTLKLAGSVKELKRALTDHLPTLTENGELHNIMRDDAPADEEHLPPEADADAEPEVDAQNSDSGEEFQFSTQGKWVATFYDTQFFIGQVIEVNSPQSATVQYLQRLKSRPDFFRWPAVDDVADTSAYYVFKWDFQVVPVNRLWQVPDVGDIEEAWRRISCGESHQLTAE